jgi:hypothetical protein
LIALSRMALRCAPGLRPLPLTLGAATLLACVALLVWDVAPRSFPSRAHDVLGALPLGLVAVAYLAHELVRKPSLYDLARAGLLAGAFFFWAANQYWPDSPRATLFNDLAVVLFVLDVVLTMLRSSPTPTITGQP